MEEWTVMKVLLISRLIEWFYDLIVSSATFECDALKNIRLFFTDQNIISNVKTITRKK